MKNTRIFSFTLNGKPVRVEAEENILLLDLLREKLGLTGTKRGCGEGECGACTVLVEDKAVNSCLYPAGKVEGKEVFTVEGLARGEKLHPLQEAFLEEGAVQCGFCTPGMLMSAMALLKKNNNPRDEQITEAISGNLCRCTGYVKILKAIKTADKKWKRII